MKSRTEIILHLEKHPVIAIIRMTDIDKIDSLVDALQLGGIDCIEVSMNTPDAIEIIDDLTHQDSDVVWGAGTVLDPETARRVIEVGARFIVTPTLNLDVIQMAHRYDTVIIPGALTPTEILTAWEHGADMVKIFPASLGGPSYIKSILGPLPYIKCVPTGGVSLENAAEFLKAGASCVAIGSSLINKHLIADDNFKQITENARELMDAVQEIRNRI